MDNMVTIFGNGMADLRFGYDVSPDGTEISIPVKTEHLSDGINLTVFGAQAKDKIQIVQPARFKPKSANASVIKIDGDNPLTTLLSRLRGSKVNIIKQDDSTITGRLLGTDSVEEDHGTYKVTKVFVSVCDTGGIIRGVNTAEIKQYTFTDKDVQDQIDRAMDAAFSQIRPSSSLIQMKLKSKEKARAIIGMTVPLAAWAMQYQIRQSGEVWRLTGSAIVHNNTDKAWEDAVIRCVTGVPYTVEITDLAEPKVPTRNKLNIITGHASGGTEATRGFTPSQKNRLMSAQAACAPSGGLESVGDTNYARIGSYGGDVQSDFTPPGLADTGTGDAVEMGDFTLLTPLDSDGKPLKQTIPPNSSATIDMIATDLKDCRPELYYNYNQDQARAGRPQIALRFTNSLPHSLQKGPCNVFVRDKQGIDLFQGTAILPISKPGESRHLLHGEDTGVDITREGGTIQRDYDKIVIEKGVVYTEMANRSSINYRIRSVKTEACELVIDHERVLPNSTATINSDTESDEETANGKRYRLKVRSKSQEELKITETFVEKSKVEFTDITWLNSQIIVRGHPSGKNIKGLEAAIEIQKKIAAKELEYQTNATEESSLEKHQSEVRKNIESTKGTEHSLQFQTTLVANDKKLQEIRRTALPKLKVDIEKLQVELRESLKQVTLNWSK